MFLDGPGMILWKLCVDTGNLWGIHVTMFHQTGLFHFKRRTTMKEKFYKYILENSTLDHDGRMLVDNILEWIWVQAMDKEDTVNALLLLLDGIGLTKEEISQFINW